jgi:protein-S-isoprenylcysteine O-methyltransferase Ste14
MNVWASGKFSRLGTPIHPFQRSTRLLTDGLYRYTRNPMYVGMMLILVGLSLILGTLGTVLVIPVFAWLIERNFIVVEERALEQAFGERYREYRRRVRRWL